jgi:type I restriction enzyme M protein
MLSDNAKAKQIHDNIWSTLDQIRSSMDIGEFKQYFLTLYFYKYISDQWLSEKYLINEGKANPGEVRFIIPDRMDFNQIAQIHPREIVTALTTVLSKIEAANDHKLAGIFKGVDFDTTKWFGGREAWPLFLCEMLRFLSTFNFSAPPWENNLAGELFELLLESFAIQEGKKGGDLHTPRGIINLIAGLANPKRGEDIYDPACGAGSLLIKVSEGIASDNGLEIFGQEIDQQACNLAKMNMILHGLDNAQIQNGDTLNYPYFFQYNNTPSLRKFDVVVSNPPFAIKNWWHSGHDRYNRFEWGMPPESKGDYAFILHMLASAKEHTGRVVILVSHGTLFRGGIEQQIRRRLVDENLLEAVIGLPSNLLYSTGIPAAILVFNKKTGKRNNVLFIDASKEFEQEKRKNVLSEKNIERIINTYQEFSATPSLKSNIIEQGYSYAADCDEIAKNDFNLNIPRYVHIDETREVDVKELKRDIEMLKERLAKIEKELHMHLEDL